MSGKGSTRRPRCVPLAEYAANHERTFGGVKQVEAQERFVAYHRGEADAPSGYVDLRKGQLDNQLRFEAERHAAISRHIDSLPESQWIEPAPSPGSADAEA